MSFSTILVANRGEIARRIIRTAYSMGVRTIAVFVDADADAPFVSEADESVRLASGYLDGAAIIDAALGSGAEAVHPGYGFLSENPGFAAEVTGAGLTWIGPPGSVIAQMGDKLAAKRLAVAAGVPTLPSAESPGDADGVGYPLIVKAAAGGGGKGMRIVGSPSDLDAAVASARRETAGAFGDDRVFLERYVATSRHIEVQILGDGHGRVIHLGERDCTAQRRYQKLVEETPAPGLPEGLRADLHAAAIRFAERLAYRGAGTVEFLVDRERGTFHFLEMNARIQVEHPITEAVTGVDLIAEQIAIAGGSGLRLSQSDVRPSGCAIECRVNAEDVENEFRPSPGVVRQVTWPSGPGIRVDTHIVAGSAVPPFYDSLLAKIIAHGPDRAGTVELLREAIASTHLDGVHTNLAFHEMMLADAEFRAGAFDTGFVARLLARRTATEHAPDG